MVRIKDIPDFYQRLQALEAPTEESQRAFDRGDIYIVKYGLQNYTRDSPEILALRAELLAPSDPKQKTHGSDFIDSNLVWTDMIIRGMRSMGYSNKITAHKIGMHATTFSNKRIAARWTGHELERLEMVLHLDKGSLLKRRNYDGTIA